MHESPEHWVMHLDVKPAGEITLLTLMYEKPFEWKCLPVDAVSSGTSSSHLRHLHTADYKSHVQSTVPLRFSLFFKISQSFENTDKTPVSVLKLLVEILIKGVDKTEKRNKTQNVQFVTKVHCKVNMMVKKCFYFAVCKYELIL